MNNNRFLWTVRPIALKENIVCGNNYRFTILTSRLIRIEFDPSGKFEDRASQSVFFRDFPKVSFSMQMEAGVLTIKTEHLMLTYNTYSNCFEENLKICLLAEPASEWHFGDEFEDLGGTAKTLDTVNGALPLGHGVCSRNGYSVMDDSERMILEADGWVGLRNPDTRDVYFFGYAYDYLEAVQDYYRLTGIPPMLPAYALGNWWSRYYKYTQQEYLDLMDRFREEDIPFSVGVIDMDWHVVNVPSELAEQYRKFHRQMGGGWTGYSWNKELFPNYKEFLKDLNEKNIVPSLNLHPAQGIRKHEDMFAEMARAMGKDPEETLLIPFDILDPKFMENYFDVVHHPYEEDGVGFWWMDFQQGKTYYWKHGSNPDAVHDPREVLDPLWMLNHLHILDIARNGKRPMFFSRFSGPGSQRYPVGFSGDTAITWETLAFQPYFTATASNIGYGWWSHDIGGHMLGYRDDELLVRWMQLGVFSPINRLHSGAYETLHKEPWHYDSRISEIMRETLRLRHKLFPYIYTMNYKNHSELIPLIQPMYYSHPKINAAYNVPNQYWFGSELVVAPIVEKNNPIDQLGKAECWLPQGDWFDLFNGTRYISESKFGRKMEVFRPLESYPVFAKAGAIVPMAMYEKHDNRLLNAENMQVIVFPGNDNNFTLYEDEGEYSNFQKGHYVTTRMSLTWGETANFTIEPGVGDISLIPKVRNWNISLRGFHDAIEVKVFINGKPAEYMIEKESTIHTTNIIVTASSLERINVEISGNELMHSNEDAEDKWLDILQHAQVGYRRKKEIAETLRSEDKSLHMKLFYISGASLDEHHLDCAIKEIMTLNRDEYRNFVDGYAD